MSDSEGKTYTIDEISSHKDNQSCWMVIHGKVYDVTPFLEEHPGGEDVLIENAGQDATDEFEDIGHSASAKEIMAKYEIGICPDIDSKSEEKKEESFKPIKNEGGLKSLIPILLPIVFVIIAIFYSIYQSTPAKA